MKSAYKNGDVVILRCSEEKLFQNFFKIHKKTPMKHLTVLYNTREMLLLQRRLVYFNPIFYFYTPFGFLTFSGDIETEHCPKMG